MKDKVTVITFPAQVKTRKELALLAKKNNRSLAGQVREMLENSLALLRSANGGLAVGTPGPDAPADDRDLKEPKIQP